MSTPHFCGDAGWRFWYSDDMSPCFADVVFPGALALLAIVIFAFQVLPLVLLRWRRRRRTRTFSPSAASSVNENGSGTFSALSGGGTSLSSSSVVGRALFPEEKVQLIVCGVLAALSCASLVVVLTRDDEMGDGSKVSHKISPAVVSAMASTVAWVFSAASVKFAYSHAHPPQPPFVLRYWWVLAAAVWVFRFRTAVLLLKRGGFMFENAMDMAKFGGSLVLMAYALVQEPEPVGYVDDEEGADASRRMSTASMSSLNVPLLLGDSLSGTAPAVAVDEATAPRPRVTAPRSRLSKELTASLVSLLTFRWLSPLMVLGRRQPLEHNDLPELRPGDSSPVNVQRFMRAWGSMTHRPPRTAVMRALWRAFGRFYWRTILFKLINDVFIFTGPMMLHQVVSFVKNKDEPMWHGYMYALAMLAGSGIQSLAMAQYWHLCFRLSVRVRAALAPTVYRKAFRLSSTSRSEYTTGAIVNLMSVDVQRLYQFVPYSNLLWSAPFQIVIAVYLLYRVIGWSVFVGIALMIAVMPLNALLAKRQFRLSKAVMKFKDRRVRVMSEVLAGMKVIKLFNWENSFLRKIEDVRSAEVVNMFKNAYTGAVGAMIWVSTPILVASFTFLAYTLAGNELTAAKAFTALALFNVLRFPLSALPMVVSSGTESFVSVKRLSAFLLAEESLSPLEEAEMRPSKKRQQGSKSKTKAKMKKGGQPNDTFSISDAHAGAHAASDNDGGYDGEDDVVLRFDNASFTYGDESAAPQLHSLNLAVKRNSLLAVTGRVGSGKTSLASALWGDMRRLSGHVSVKGKIAYAAQQPWIQNATLRDNILFGEPFDQKRYDSVVFACALTQDLEMLPDGDLTEIGERGINLSGGQKQRVSLARACYSRANIIVMDDPLSAVDVHVGGHIFTECISSFLSNRTRILIMHQLYLLPQVDEIAILEEGNIVETGTYDALVAKGINFDEFAADDEEADEEEADADENAGKADAKNAKGAVKNKGSKAESGHGDGVAGGGDAKVDGGAKKDGSTVKDKSKDDTSSSPAAAAHSHGAATAAAKGKADNDDKKKEGGKLMTKEERKKGVVALQIWRAYAVAAGGLSIGFLVLFVYGLTQGDQVLTNWWLSNWSEHAADEDGHGSRYYLYVYLGLGGGATLLALLRGLVLAYATMTAAKNLHNETLGAVMFAPMSFFDTTPMGRILNRFSSDQETLDDRLRPTVSGYFSQCFALLGVIGVIAAVTPIFSAAFVPLAVVYYYVQSYYRSTSRELKRLDSISKSPIYAHFTETLHGVPTIRAYRQEGRFIKDNESKIDHNGKALFVSNVINRWLALRLELLGMIVVFGAALFAVFEHNNHNMSAGLIGLSLTYALEMTGTLNWLIRSFTMTEVSLVAVERLKQYGPDELPNERPHKIAALAPPAQWPPVGAIEFKNLSMRYRPNLPLVVKNVSVTINAGEKIGIVGRTGAGKSSILLALFRLVEPEPESQILIDGVDVTKIGLADLRSKLSVIPQDPMLFEGTIRTNLDPFSEYPDFAIWDALERAELKPVVEALEGKLESEVKEDGSNFSVGQRQLFCLARALLRPSKVLVLDEATASLDAMTDTLITKALTTAFKGRTTITVAHRIHTILASDKVMVMSNGEVVEFGEPSKLLQQEDSVFAGMVKTAQASNEAIIE